MTIRLQQPEAGPRIHQAGWVMADPWTILRDGFVTVADGLIREVGQGTPRAGYPVTDHGPGVILPALINAHTHLELSALSGKVPFENGFQPWVQQLLQAREAMGTNALISGAKVGIEELKASGCAGVGEISTLGLTRALLWDSGLSGIWFQEFLGGAAEAKISLDQEEEGTVLPSLAGHAPHTTAPELLRALKKAASGCGRPFSIHLDESQDEIEFLTTARGPWADFLGQRGIGFSDWGLPADSPVQYAEELGILDEKTLAVHLIHAGPPEFEILKKRWVHVCLCPRSNLNLHGQLPDLEGMLRAGLRPCLGTDSLASTDSLSLFDEMAFTARAFPSVRPEEILAAATLNSAGALGLSDRFGTLAPGKSATFVYVPVTASTPSALPERLIHELSV